MFVIMIAHVNPKCKHLFENEGGGAKKFVTAPGEGAPFRGNG